MEYIFSTLNVCSNLYVGPFSRINMLFFLLSIWAEELISTLRIKTFWPNPPLGNVKLDLLSSPLPKQEYPYFLISAFFVKVTAPIKQFFSVRSLSLELEAPSL